MDLFGFASDAGRKLFRREDNAAESIKEHIEENNPGVAGLDCVFSNGVATISGTFDDRAALKKCILMAGNVSGVKAVDLGTVNIKAPELPEPIAVTTEELAADEAEVQYYVIQSGDTLGKIAKEFLGNAMDYPKIFEANREVIQDPDKIFPGQKIIIPARDA